MRTNKYLPRQFTIIAATGGVEMWNYGMQFGPRRV